MKKYHLYLFVLSFISLASEAWCSETFTDKTSELGLQLANQAAACFDYNQDGWVDIFCSGTLWKNNGGKSFSKVFSTNGNAVSADYDNDGFPDIFCYSSNKLFHNDKGENFSPQPFPEIPAKVSRAACWADFNGDGFNDLYIGGFEIWEKQITYPDALAINQQGKSWLIIPLETQYRARGVSACDFDQDGDIDIYVSNYRLQPNILWRNDGTNNFTNAADSHNAAAAWDGFNGGHSIGAAWGDFDNDGLLDIFAGNFAHDDNRGHQPHSCFLRNTGPDSDYVFNNMGQGGIHYQESYASPAVADFDNDGDIDLYFTTVYGTASFGKKNFPVLLTNEGSWNFKDCTDQYGIANLPPTYQAAWADFNNDGAIDLVTAGRVFINQNNDNKWLKIKLIGDGTTINSEAVGSQVRIKINDKTLTRQVEAGTGEGNQNELTLHFGLAQHDTPVSLDIFWTKQLYQKVDNVNINQLITIKFDKNNCTEKAN